MDKIIVNGKEIEINKDGRILLTDEELESASGGQVLPRDMMFYQWKCREPGCGCASEWYDSSFECKCNLSLHISEKRHYQYDVIIIPGISIDPQ